MRATRRAGAMVVGAVLAVTLAGCDRSPRTTVDRFLDAFDEGTIDEHPELFDAAPTGDQADHLRDLGERCSVTKAPTMETSDVASYLHYFGVVVTCDGEAMALGGSLSEQCAENDCDARIDAASLPGGEAGGHINPDLPDEIAALEPVT